MNGVTSKANIAKSQVFSNSLRNALMLNLVSEWKLDGNANDSWSGGNNGTWYGAGGGTNTSANYRPSSECVSGQCLNLDGTDDYVNCGNGANLSFGTSTDFTIASWFKTTATYGYVGYVLSKGGQGGNNRYALLINNGKLEAYIQGTGNTVSLDSAVSVNNNVFNYGVATFSRSGNLTLYLNGTISGTPTSIASVGNIDSANSFSIGARGATDTFLNGSIDDVRVFNAAIPVSQIKEQYYAGLNNLLKNKAISIEEYLEKIGLNN
jgi:hypothetical protein